MIRVVRDGSLDVKEAVKCGVLSIRAAERQVAVSRKSTAAPIGPLCDRGQPRLGALRSQGDLDRTPDTLDPGGRLIPTRVGSSGLRKRTASTRLVESCPEGAAAMASMPPIVHRTLTLCDRFDGATARFVEATAHWTGDRLEQRNLTIWQSVRHVEEILDALQTDQSRG
jgi:hypothetical protein